MARERIQLLQTIFPEFLKTPPPRDPAVVQTTPEITAYFRTEMESLEGRHWEIFHPKEPPPPVEEPLQLMEWVKKELAKEKLKSNRVSPDISTVNGQLAKLNQHIIQLIKENNLQELNTGDRRSIVKIHDEIGEQIKTDPDYKYFRLTLAKITPAVEELRVKDGSSWRPAQEQPTSSVKGHSPHSATAAATLPSAYNEDDLTLQGAEGFSPEAYASTKQQESGDSNIITEVKELLALAIKEFNENQPDDEKRISVSACVQALTYSIKEQGRTLTIEAIEELVGSVEASIKEEPNIKAMMTPLLNALYDTFAALLMSTASITE
ncbi:hypothetical protein [Endozoicomonas elysicola]|uniref:Uncharacterized protein n=1 Tax=Endozoicomonas elysicola TaxID=305900 RepID=A0A081K965_9GAMM|nr:hypothetical protein [Endozoicomonas elysicola]KEI70691.1 hypothetical protein GV64_08015 [Endozoicomonas elysicola]